jgi:hypothetical protein
MDHIYLIYFKHKNLWINKYIYAKYNHIILNSKYKYQLNKPK